MIKKNLKISFVILSALVVIRLLNYLFPIEVLGIIPRQIKGMGGILLAPLIHGDIMHLINNIVPLFFLLLILAVKFARSFLKILITLTILTGVMVWIFAQQGVHIGASGLIFALTTFLIVKCFFLRSFYLLLPLVIFLIYYGNIYKALFPVQLSTWQPISHSSHWFGVLMGLLLPLFQRKWNN